ncbi:MAG TPA: hypothetical protein VHF87_13955 [Methylomirabilota bacterium]|jgi:hypothetical protein|nr:hypothetical protein [Methylomirabilota bacterium]
MRNAVVVVAWRSGAVILALALSAMPALAQKGLVSVRTDQPRTIDRTVDAAWEKVPAYEIKRKLVTTGEKAKEQDVISVDPRRGGEKAG